MKTFTIQVTQETVFKHFDCLEIILGTVTAQKSIDDGGREVKITVSVGFGFGATLNQCVAQCRQLRAFKRLIVCPKSKMLNFKYQEFFTVYLMFKNITDSCFVLQKNC